ncbi:MAG: hypothetical protein IKR80_03570 [Spirochaetales bacterium]|nr:hypothetical protein [Spirochaetales bacterium]
MHPKQEILEEKMAQLCQALDNHLEDIYGDHYRLHPNRLRRGKGSNPSFDGLFSTSLAFTLGYGSEYGRGYVVNVEIRTLDKVSQYDSTKIQAEAFSFISQNLKKFIPDQDLKIVQDGNLMKVVGDFSLGDV